MAKSDGLVLGHLTDYGVTLRQVLEASQRLADIRQRALAAGVTEHELATCQRAIGQQWHDDRKEEATG